ncbi:hypothetical protein D9C73_019460 [Collichthys lucidus]|uniref:Uncharacterized protein n=1 Tax=Collichthys lucidus TaxID=240159 RepID=A0A4V6ARV1_COLLU|nr:hypothetical protein D9C73_019460 [Collichthys lucidus]
MRKGDSVEEGERLKGSKEAREEASDDRNLCNRSPGWISQSNLSSVWTDEVMQLPWTRCNLNKLYMKAGITPFPAFPFSGLEVEEVHETLQQKKQGEGDTSLGLFADTWSRFIW